MEAVIHSCIDMSDQLLIVDYGMGNLWSVQSALRYLGVEPIITGDPDLIVEADMLVLPGVGSFNKAMNTLNNLGITEALREAVQVRKHKILGICLGMQLMAEKGIEDGEHSGLGFIPGTVNRFSQGELGALKLPHIGFNLVNSTSQSKLFKGVTSSADFYFVHSYRLLAEAMTGEQCVCNYGIEFLAAYENKNIFATQFHPEKSQTNGLQLLNNFLTA